jgi:histidyl-tRNA synthetase
VIAGTKEVEKGTVSIKNMVTGEQEEIVAGSIVEYITK